MAKILSIACLLKAIGRYLRRFYIQGNSFPLWSSLYMLYLTSTLNSRGFTVSEHTDHIHKNEYTLHHKLSQNLVSDTLKRMDLLLCYIESARRTGMVGCGLPDINPPMNCLACLCLRSKKPCLHNYTCMLV